MKSGAHGPSFLYANDKNIFDALNEYKVDANTVAGLFEKRNTLVSPRDSREALARYFASLPHDYFDHKDIAAKLGVVARRERVTSLDLVVAETADGDCLEEAVAGLVEGLKDSGEVVQIKRLSGIVTLHVQYTKLDYGRSEFNQVQTRDGSIEIHKSDEGYIVRSTQNEYMNNLRDGLVERISKVSADTVERREVSLSAWTNPKIRSSFFYHLFTRLVGYDFRDVTDIFVYKPPAGGDADDLEDDADSRVVKVSLKGTGVTRSAFLSELGDDGYYTYRVGWKVQDQGAQGNVYAVEAVFAQPEDCTGFSYILVGVHENKDGVIQKQRRTPIKGEIAEVSRAIEARARHLMEQLRSYGKFDEEEDG